jgi:DNA polymerase I-like protein with 3'-5' exonuclease and polymerase domains
MLISLDIETTGLNPYRDKITVVGVYNDTIQRVFRDLNELNEWIKANPELTFVGQNFKFDLHFLHRNNINIRPEQWTDDTQLMAFVHTKKIPDGWLWAYEAKRKKQPGKHRPGSPHSLKTLAPYFLGVAPFWETEDHDNDEYVLKDAEYTWKLYKHFAATMSDEEMAFYQRHLLPWAKMLLEAEERGIQVNRQDAAEFAHNLESTKIQLEAKLDVYWDEAHNNYHRIKHDDLLEKYEKMASAKGHSLNDSPRYSKLFVNAFQKIPTKLNYDSPKQMLWLLKDFLKLNVTNLDGEESTGVAVLEQLASEGREDVATFLEWRHTKKLLEYLSSYESMIEADGCIHASFNPTGTRTGRLSSSNPNLQQVNSDLKPIFSARPGYDIIGYDLAAIEAKLITFYSEDPSLYSLISNGVSLHDNNVKVFFNVSTPIDQVKNVHPVERSATKNCGFALFYGAGGNRIKQTFQAKGFIFSDERCREMLLNYRKEYAAAFQFHKDITEVFESGQTVPNVLGRPIKIQNPQDAYMKGFNTLIQSSASDLCLEWSRRFLEAARAKGLDVTPILFVHDYLGFEVAGEHATEAEQLLLEELKKFTLNTKHGPIHLEAEGGISAVWE